MAENTNHNETVHEVEPTPALQEPEPTPTKKCCWERKFGEAEKYNEASRTHIEHSSYPSLSTNNCFSCMVNLHARLWLWISVKNAYITWYHCDVGTNVPAKFCGNFYDEEITITNASIDHSYHPRDSGVNCGYWTSRRF